MTAAPGVLQVVILRDGLLVGTEVFVPGTYTIGSSREAEVKLDDPQVDPLHALLYFQNGRAAIQDNGSRGGVYVNGHKVRACELRSQDELLIGPFLLKTRALSQSAGQKPAPPPEVAALLGGPTPPAPVPLRSVSPASAAITAPAVTAPSVRAPHISPAQTAGTVPSARRSALAAVPAPPPLDVDLPTESVPLPLDLLEEHRSDTAPELVPHGRQPTRPAVRHAPLPAPPRRHSVPQLPAATAGKAANRLYVELFWGELRQHARSFGVVTEKQPVYGAHADDAPVPLWGFTLPVERFGLVESNGDTWRLFIPPAATVEKQSAGEDAFFPANPGTIEARDGRRFLTLSSGMAARLTEGELSLVAYVAPPPERMRVNPLAGLPWLALIIFLLLGGGFVTLLALAPEPLEVADFVPRNLPPVAVKLMAPEPKKKEAAAKKLAELKEKAPKPKKETPKPVVRKEQKAPARTPPPAENKALKALAKLSAAGPATSDVLAAVDKMGSGPGAKKSNFKLSDMVGKDPIANAGIGTFGLGGGGKGGRGTKGLEVLHGAGGGGLGALGAGGYGKGGKVGGTVARASSRQVAAQGSIDRDAVAKVINAHLQEVRGCYERALLKDPGLSGKAVLEWSINTAGAVTAAKTKSSTLRNVEVEGCILRSLKTWKFPAAKGGMVIVTYPFVFNSVGY